MDLKYAKLTSSTTVETTARLHKFKPEIAEKIIELSDIKKTTMYLPSDWEALAKYCNEKKVFELSLAALKAKGIPQMYQQRIMDSMFGIEKAYVLSSKDITGNTINVLRDSIGETPMQNFMLNMPEALSQSSLYLLCYRIVDIHDRVWHCAYSKITQDNLAADFLEEILENKNGDFDEQIDDEEFLFAIATNANLPDEIRDKAFDIAACNDKILYPTVHMAKTIYEQIASTIFDVKDTDMSLAEVASLKSTAEKKLKEMIFNNELPEVCQLDYIERYKEDRYNGRKSIIEMMTKHTESPIVLSSILEMDFNMKSKVAENAKAINKDVMKTYLKLAHTDFLTRVYVRHLFQNPTSSDLVKTMLTAKDAGLATRLAVLCSYHQREGWSYQLSDLTQRIPEDERRMLQFIDRLKHILRPCQNAEVLLYKTVYNLFSKTDEYQHRNPSSAQSQLISELNDAVNFNRYKPISNHIYANLKLGLMELETAFPEEEFQNEIKRIKIETKKLYRDSYIPNNYPELFKPYETTNKMIDNTLNVMQSIHIPQTIPFSYVNIESLLKMSKEDIETLTEKLCELPNIEIGKVICDSLKDALNKIPNHEAENRFILLHKFTDMYNRVNDALEVKHSLENKGVER